MQKNALYAAILLVALLAAAALNEFGTSHQDQARPAQAPFDFYVLALSWSPAFCASERGQNAPLQCGGNADFGFITHGLWPQFEQGWPSYCQSPHGDRMAPEAVNTLLDIMPDHGLIAHQWDKHGTCSGLDPTDYAAMTRRATATITIPTDFNRGHAQTLGAREIEAAFVQANPNLTEAGIAVSCPGGRFTEVRICLNQDLHPRACEQVNRNGCQQQGLSVVLR